MSRLPASPGRTQALIEFEQWLLETFESLTRDVNAEVRDTMHYALFSTPDRFCASATWLVAPHLGIELAELAPALCAIETLTCSLRFNVELAAATARTAKARREPGHSKHERLFEPLLAEAATYGLIPLAFEMALSPRSKLSDSLRCQIGTIIAQAASPMHALSALHRESRIFAERTQHALSRDELQTLMTEKVTPAFQAAGETLALLSRRDEPRKLADWFRRLGLLAYWIGEFSAPDRHDAQLSLARLMSQPEAMDLIKSLEADLLDQARVLGLRAVAHELIEPLADLLKTRLQ